MLSGWSLKLKMIFLTIGLLSITLVVGFIGYSGIHKVEHSYARITDSSLINIVIINNMAQASANVEQTVSLSLHANLNKSAFKDEIVKRLQEYKVADKAYQDVPFVEGEEAHYIPVAEAWKKYESSVMELLKLVQEGAPHSAISEYLEGQMHSLKADFNSKIQGLIDFNHTNSKNWTDEAKTSALFSNRLMLMAMFIGLIVGLFLGVTFANSLTKIVRGVTENLNLGAEQVSSAATQVSNSAQILSTASTEQASSMEETVATMEEMTAMVKQNTQNAQTASVLSTSASEKASIGESEVKKLITSIRNISSNSNKISEITGVIDDIAFQTNLLALNAAVEAARAGEQGRGFAVVAEAVRTLAQRSAASAKDIAQLIHSSVEQVQESAGQADKSGVALEEILSVIKKVSDLNSEILAASQEQENGISQIAQAMNQLDQVTQQNAAASEESAAAAVELSSQAHQMQTNAEVLSKIVNGNKS